jgi:hypothetical protein
LEVRKSQRSPRKKKRLRLKLRLTQPRKRLLRRPLKRRKWKSHLTLSQKKSLYQLKRSSALRLSSRSRRLRLKT